MKLNEGIEQLPQYRCHKVVRAGRIHTCIAGVLGVQVGNSKAIVEVAVGRDWVEKHGPDNSGYLVAYEDGYLSYSPAEVFEAGYRELPPLGNSCGGVGGEAAHELGADFSFALRMLKAGARMARAGWNGKDQWVVLIHPGNAMYTKGGASAPMQSCLGLKNAQGNMQPGWVPSMGDLMADDWQVVS